MDLHSVGKSTVIVPGFLIFQLTQFLETLSTKLSNAGDLDGILLTGDDHISLCFVICKISTKNGGGYKLFHRQQP